MSAPPGDYPKLDCRQALDRLASVETRLSQGDRVTAAEVDVLDAHIRTCSECPHRVRARMAELEARVALRERDVPEGLLDGIYASIRDRLPSAPAGGALSYAFLDAPRALAVWRSVAVAATVVLAVGVVLWTLETSTSQEAGPRAEALRPVPAHLLRTWEANLTPTSARSASPSALPVSPAGRVFFRVLPPGATSPDETRTRSPGSDRWD